MISSLFRPFQRSIYSLPSVFQVPTTKYCIGATLTTMALAQNLQSKYKMNSGHEIPALGYGVGPPSNHTKQPTNA